MMRLLSWLIFIAVLSVGVHFALVTVTPSFIMGRVMTAVASNGVNVIAFGERPDATARRIVRPSPDLLYSTCTYDLSHYPLKISAANVAGTYWSVAFYADNTDNFYVMNDTRANGADATIILTAPGQTVNNQEPGTIVVNAPSTKGLVLFRTLINDDARLSEIDAQRRKSRCDPIVKQN